MASETSYVVGSKAVDQIREMLAMHRSAALAAPDQVTVTAEVPGNHDEIKRWAPRVSSAQAQCLEWALGLITG